MNRRPGRRGPQQSRLGPLAAVAVALLVAGCGTATGESAASSAEDSSAPAGSSSAAASESSSSAPASGEAPEQKPPQRDGKDKSEALAAAFDFTSQTVEGERFEGASLAGRPTVLWFWAPWCPTCRAQIDGVSSLAGKYGDSDDVVGVGGLDESGAIADFAAEVSPEVTMLADTEGEVWRHFAITSQSVYVVLDADGEQLADGFLEDEALRQVVADATA